MRAPFKLRRLPVLVMLVLAFVTSDRMPLCRNIALVHTVQVIFPQATAHLSELYSIRSDVQLAKDAQLDHKSLRPDDSLTLAIIVSALNNDYAYIGYLEAQSPVACHASPACRYLAGKAYLRLGQDQQAVVVWSGDEALWSRLIGKTTMTPQTEEDLQFLERYYGVLHDLAPQEPAPYFMLGSIYRSRGQWQRAMPLFEQAAAIRPDNARYLCSLGQALVITGQDIIRGLDLCDVARHRTPADMWVQEQAARTFAAAGECATAAAIYQQIAIDFSERSEPTVWLNAFREGKIGKCAVNGTK